MAEFTKERLREIAALPTKTLTDGREIAHGVLSTVRTIEVVQMARQLLAGLEQEPVAYMHRNGVSLMWAGDLDAKFKVKQDGWSPLYAAPQLPQPAVPDIATVETTYPDVQTNWQDAKMYAEGWNDCRAAMLQGAEPAAALKPAIFIDGNISPDDADKLAGAISKLNSEHREHPQIIAESVQVVPEGWDPCSPEWIERNGPCSCAEAPRIAFGSIGNHYHPHIYHNPKNEETP